MTFSAASIDAGVSQDLGVMVDDCTGKPAGNYEDAITFKVEVVDAESSAAGNTVNLAGLTGDYEAQDGDILSGTAGEDAHITVKAGATITLKDANITSISNDISHSWAGITPLGNATIILEGTNEVKGGYNDYPGIFISPDCTLTIKGTGSLTASSGGSDRNMYGAGIGGGNKIACGNIIIELGPTITANSGSWSAGIGSGARASCGNITINGGTITATGGLGGTGIGTGNQNSSCGNITISGGTINATSGQYGAGIGTGSNGYYGNPTCGNIIITSGVTSVTATKGSGAKNSIGLGSDAGTCGTVTIGCTLDADGNPVGGTVGAITDSPYTYTPGN